MNGYTGAAALVTLRGEDVILRRHDQSARGDPVQARARRSVRRVGKTSMASRKIGLLNIGSSLVWRAIINPNDVHRTLGIIHRDSCL